MITKILASFMIFLPATLLSSSAYAYLDPGTGSMILQGVIAGLAMASLTFKMYWYKLKSFFSKNENMEMDEMVENVEMEDHELNQPAESSKTDQP